MNNNCDTAVARYSHCWSPGHAWNVRRVAPDHPVGRPPGSTVAPSPFTRLCRPGRVFLAIPALPFSFGTLTPPCLQIPSHRFHFPSTFSRNSRQICRFRAQLSWCLLAPLAPRSNWTTPAPFFPNPYILTKHFQAFPGDYIDGRFF